MLRKIGLLLGLGMIMCSLAACTSQTQEVKETVPVKEVPQISESISGDGTETTDKATEQLPDFTFKNGESLTFADMKEYSYEFSSGAGGWSTNFTIEADGSFSGNFHDSDMGCTGDGYPNGTLYVSAFRGKFSNLTKITPYCYEMTLENISYEEEMGKEEILDGTLFVYLDAYGLEGTDTFKVYLPGMELSELGEDVNIWIQYANDDETTLKIPIIVNEANGYGIYTYVRPSVIEEAQAEYHSYRESYDYYEGLLKNSITTLNMQENAASMYKMADELLNNLWIIMKNNMDNHAYQIILEEQRAWIKAKEEHAEEVLKSYEGGSQGAVDYNLVLAEETMKRCDVLLQYIKEMK